MQQRCVTPESANIQRRLRAGNRPLTSSISVVFRAVGIYERVGFVEVKWFSNWIAMKHDAMTMQSSFEGAIENGAGVPGKVPQNSPHDIASNGNHSPASANDEIENTNENGVLIADDCQRSPFPMPRAGLEPAQPHLAGGF